MKKIIGIVIIIFLVSVGLYFILSSRNFLKEKPAPVPLILEEVKKEMPVSTEVGYGWSIKDDSQEAVKEALAKLKKDLQGKTPHFLFLFYTVGYDGKVILNEIRKELGEGTQIYGGTSCLATLTKDGYHLGKTGSLALLGVASPDYHFGVGGVSLDDFPSAKEAGREAVLLAIKKAGKIGEKPKLVLLTAAPGKEEEIILGIEEVVGKEVPIIGGSSGDNDISGKWQQFALDRVYSNGIALAVVYTENKIGFAYEAGYERTERIGKITKAQGRVIYEIDGRPAAEVYNEWTGGLIKEKLTKGGSVLTKTTFFPLAKVVPSLIGEPQVISIHPLGVNLPEKSLTVFANVKEGEEIMLLRGNWQILLNRAQITPAKAMNLFHLQKKDVLFSLYTYCAGTMLAIPEGEREKIPLLIKNEIGEAPFLGTFTFGEQGYLPGIGNRHGNLVNSVVIFTSQK